MREKSRFRSALGVFILLPALVLLVGCQAPPAEPAGLTEEDRAAIRESIESLREATLAGDWAAYAGHFTEDGAALPPNGRPLEGRAAIEEWASGYSVSGFTMEETTLEGEGGLAYRRGTFSIRLTPPGMEEEVTDEGKLVEIWQEQSDGSWEIAVSIWNSSRPIEPPSEE